MLKILVTYAVQGEFVEIKWPDVEPYYIRTGIGKVKSAFHLAEAIRQVQPDLVLNLRKCRNSQSSGRGYLCLPQIYRPRYAETSRTRFGMRNRFFRFA